MAISWGSEVRNSTGNGMRVGYEFSQSPSSVGTGTSSVTVTVKVYVWTRASVYDSTNTLSISGNFSWSGDVNISHGGGGGTTLVRTLTRTVSPSYSGTVKSSVSISLTGINAISGTARASGSWTTQKRPISGPASPSNANVSRSSDTRHVVSWSRASSPAGAPVQNQVVARWDIASGNWRNIATVSGSATSYTDSSTVANQQYRYRVQSKNSAGSSGWAYTPYIATTPAPPTSLKAQRQGSDVKLTWSLAGIRKHQGVEVWLTADGVDQSPRHMLFAAGQTSWVHSNPDPTKTWSYRLKTGVWPVASNETGPSLWSAYSSRSNTVQLLAPPSAPSKLSPSSTAADASDGHRFKWQHNSIDTTDQTAYELQYRVDGGAWASTGKTNTSNEYRDLPADTFENGTTVEWQVRTWGDYANPSPWSQLAVLTMSGRPAASIIYPAPEEGSTTNPVVDSSRITAEWEYFDPEDTTQIGARLRIEDSHGATMWSVTLNTAATTYPIPYTVSDGGTYTLTVAVRDGSGLWSDDSTQTFDVVYAKPPAPMINAEWDLDLGGVAVTIEHPEPGEGEVEAVRADLQRSFNGEDWETFSADVDPSTTVVDFIPALDTINYYRVISYTSLAASIESQPIPVQTESKGWLFVNGGPDWSYICRVRDNVSTSNSPKRQKVMNHFAGRMYPVETSGQGRTRDISVSGRLSGGASSSYDWETLLDQDGPVCYREPAVSDAERSVRVFASFQEYSVSRERVFQEVSMTFQRVEEV